MAVHPPDMPVLSLVASPGKRQAVLDLAVEAERRGFAGIACPTLGGALGLCVSLAHVTREIRFFTSIQGLYGTHANELAGIAAHIHEITGGRFALGLGVSHHAMVKRFGVRMGPPLGDMRQFVDALHAQERFLGEMPPVYVAALRDRMLDLAVEIGQGALWANSSLRYTATQIGRIGLRDDFYRGVMLPTVITDDDEAAKAVHRRTLTTYVRLPNYRNYWRAAGYVEEMDVIEEAVERNDREALPGLMSDEWLRDCTVWGTPSQVRDRFAEWSAIGVQPIAVMSSVRGGQATAVSELFAAYA